ncbi:hypothetical protein D3C76_1495870 [compost metagenome]
MGSLDKNIKAYAAALSGGDTSYEKLAADSYKINTTDGYVNFYYGIPNEANLKLGRTVGDLDKQMMERLIVSKPAEFDAMYDSLVKEYMNAGGKAIQEENIKNYKAVIASRQKK